MKMTLLSLWSSPKVSRKSGREGELIVSNNHIKKKKMDGRQKREKLGMAGHQGKSISINYLASYRGLQLIITATDHNQILINFESGEKVIIR